MRRIQKHASYLDINLEAKQVRPASSALKKMTRNNSSFLTLDVHNVSSSNLVKLQILAQGETFVAKHSPYLEQIDTVYMTNNR